MKTVEMIMNIIELSIAAKIQDLRMSIACSVLNPCLAKRSSSGITRVKRYHAPICSKAKSVPVRRTHLALSITSNGFDVSAPVWKSMRCSPDTTRRRSPVVVSDTKVSLRVSSCSSLAS